MRRESFKNFLNEEERLELIDWFNSSPCFMKGRRPSGKIGPVKRETTRHPPFVDFPPLVEKLKERAFSLFNFTEECKPQIFKSGFSVVAVKTFEGGSTPSHKDSNLDCDLSILRLNVIVQKPESGGILHVMDENREVIPWETDEGELHCYEVTQHIHAVTKVEGNTPRFILLFSMQVPYEDWENGKITVNNQILN